MDAEAKFQISNKALVFFCILLFIASSLLAFWGIQQIERKSQAGLNRSMQTVHDSTIELVNLWLSSQMTFLRNQASKPQFVQLSEKQLRLYQNNSLYNSSELKSWRRQFLSALNASNAVFFIIGRDGTNLGASSDELLGRTNLLRLKRPDLFSRVLLGESLLVPPLISDIAVSGSRNVANTDKPPTMMVAVPVFGSDGSVIGIFSLLLDPRGVFSNILSSGRIGASGETYAVNEQAKLVSTSRFSHQLQQMGLFHQDEQEILSVDIKSDNINRTQQDSELTIAARGISAKQDGADFNGYIDYRGARVVGVWTWNEQLGLGFVTEMDWNEAFEIYSFSRWIIIAILVLLFIISMALTWLIFFTLKRANTSLLDASVHLEQEVQQRTADLAKSQQLLEQVMNGVPALIYMKDREGHYRYVNQRFEQLKNMNNSQILGHTDADIFPEEVANRLMEADKKVLKSGLVEVIEEEVTFPDGVCRWFLSNKLPVRNDNGDIEALLGISMDINDRKRVEQELTSALIELEKSKLKAEKASEAKGDFLANMSHEIRTPMNGVLAMLELVLKTDLESMQKQKINIAYSSARAMLVLINDILDFSKIESGKLQLEKVEFNLIKELEDVVRSFTFKCFDKGLALILDIAEIKQQNVIGDPGRLRQVINNLLGNALKFTEAGEIIVSAKLHRDKGKLSLDFQVKDTGIGIPEEGFSHLFESFTQVDASTTRKYGGTGLGLAISQRLCALMGGKINVESELGQGSCFSFSIPLEAPQNTHFITATEVMREFSVLIIEENTANRDAIAKQYRAWGARCSEIATPNDAELMMRSDRYNLIIVDLHTLEKHHSSIDQLCSVSSEHVDTKFILMLASGTIQQQDIVQNRQVVKCFVKPLPVEKMLALSLAIANKDKSAINNRNNADVIRAKTQESDTLIPMMRNKNRVLLVEDNGINQMVAEEVLKNLGISIEVAENGQQAIDALVNSEQSEPYNLVLMDCQMPVMDGYEATRQIREGKAGDRYKNLAIVAMTANAMKGDKEKCLDAGMDDYLPKPLDIDYVKDVLADWL